MITPPVVVDDVEEEVEVTQEPAPPKQLSPLLHPASPEKRQQGDSPEGHEYDCPDGQIGWPVEHSVPPEVELEVELALHPIGKQVHVSGSMLIQFGLQAPQLAVEYKGIKY